MTPVWDYVKGDTSPELIGTAKDPAGAAIDLDGYTGTVRFTHRTTRAELDFAATFGADGSCTYEPAADDFATADPGLYEVQFRAESGGNVITIPTREKVIVAVREF